MKRIISILLSGVFLMMSDAAADYAMWTWSQHLPNEIATDSARAHRTAEAVDNYFRTGVAPLSVPKLLDFLGPPDGFSEQFIYSKTQGSKEPSKHGGTLRFLLDNGGEVHVWTHDFRQIGYAFRHPKKGDSKILYK